MGGEKPKKKAKTDADSPANGGVPVVSTTETKASSSNGVDGEQKKDKKPKKEKKAKSDKVEEPVLATSTLT